MYSARPRYTFRLCTTSFLYPAGYADNVARVAPLVDEIELLLFESDPAAWPSRDEIKRLIKLAQLHDLTYNVHLPLDLALGDPTRTIRRQGVDRLVRLLKHVAGLSATSFTLHLDYTALEQTPATVSAWQAFATSSLSDLLARTILPPRLFAVETLNYPPEWLASIVESLDLSVCLDVGHLLLHGFSLAEAITNFQDRIAIVHLHGVEAGLDHRSVAHLPPATRATLLPFLRQFNGSVSLELFSRALFEDSLLALNAMMAAPEKNSKA